MRGLARLMVVPVALVLLTFCVHGRAFANDCGQYCRGIVEVAPDLAGTQDVAETQEDRGPSLIDLGTAELPGTGEGAGTLDVAGPDTRTEDAVAGPDVTADSSGSGCALERKKFQAPSCLRGRVLRRV